MAKASPSKRSVTRASASPLKRKTKISSITSTSTPRSIKSNQQDYTNWITSAQTAVNGIDVHYVTKWMSNKPEKKHLPPQNAYLYPYKEYYKKKDGVFGNSNIKAFMPRRDPSREGQVTLPGEEGKSFPWDLLVTERPSDDDTAESMGRNVAKEFVKYGLMHPEIFNQPPPIRVQRRCHCQSSKAVELLHV